MSSSPSAASVAAGAIASGRPPKTGISRERRVDSRGIAPTDQNLIATMAARLSQVERLNAQQATKIAKQAQEIDMLRAELEVMRSCGGEESSSETEGMDVQALRADRARCKRQMEEMHKFLADYGLTWVGSRGDDADVDSEDDAGAGSAKASCADTSPGWRKPQDNFVADVQAVKAQVESLNNSVESEGAKVVSERVGGAVRARLAQDDTSPLPLALFRDGVKLGRLAFQPYSEHAAQQIVRDILDGYFPYVLKDDYPEGTGLKVIDRTGLSFEAWLRSHAETDQELADEGDRCLPAVGRLVRPMALGRNTSAPAQGRRSGADVSMLLVGGRDPAAPFARLQVKLAESCQRVVLHMEPEQTVGALEDALARWRAELGDGQPGGCGGPPRSLRTAFPPQVYTDRGQTLRDAGLFPTATLFVSAADIPDG